MRRLFLFLWPVTVLAQPEDLPTGVKLTPAVSPPPIVLTRFSSEFPNQQGSWSQRGDYYAASFTADNRPQVAEFDKTGKRIASYRKISAKEAPDELKSSWRDAPSELWERKDTLRTLYFTIEGKDTVWYDVKRLKNPKGK
jgi:hypothetical protein